LKKSDIVVQIVDARNPLLFRSIDLENYVKEVDPKKKNLLLVNKADLLSPYQRLEWAKFFRKSDIDYLFFSANFEKLKLEENSIPPEMNLQLTADTNFEHVENTLKKK